MRELKYCPDRVFERIRACVVAGIKMCVEPYQDGDSDALPLLKVGEDGQQAELPCRLVAISGTGDKFAPQDGVAAWAEIKAPHFNMHTVKGPHMFLTKQATAVKAIVNKELKLLSQE